MFVRLPPELVAWLDQEAQRRDRSRAWVIEHACNVLRAIKDATRDQEAGT